MRIFLRFCDFDSTVERKTNSIKSGRRGAGSLFVARLHRFAPTRAVVFAKRIRNPKAK
jgi:hypothetical protein